MSAPMITLTYDELAALVKEAKGSAIENGASDPPAGYESLTPEQAAIADACWHAGMDLMETAVMNAAFDRLGMSRDCPWSSGFQKP